MQKRLFPLLLLLLCSASFALAQHPIFWSDAPESTISTQGHPRLIFPKKYRTIQWNLPMLKAQLEASAMENAQTEIALPMPDGSVSRYVIWESSVMHPDLQAKYPEIRCYTGKGIDDPGSVLKCDLTPWGFHAMTFSGDNGSVFIDPYVQGDGNTGIVYYKKDFERPTDDNFACLPLATAEKVGAELGHSKSKKSSDLPEFAGDCKKRTYRLALACTGEYATFHGGTKALVLAAMNTSMNRVNGVYEKDLAITMQIIAKNDTLIFLNASTDPYTNNDGGTMLDENQATVTQRIGAANYDIGHVFSTGGGGIAGLGVVCSNGNKANGVTGSGAPIGDPFDIDYVAHEMGHQFGGNHSFNNSCGGNRNNSTAMEPGSGSTIMGYAGICPPDVQSNSDDYFHAINIQEIIAYTNSGNGNSCPVKTITGNSSPVVANVPNYTIPKSTPFALTASATDADNDALTYCWEQMDAATATMPPVSTSTGGPLFRSYDPVSSPTRYFPRLPDLVTNTNSTWEELPGVARTMNFRVVVRDNHAGGGCTGEDNVTLTVSAAAGPFVVLIPNTNVTWTVGETQSVTWNVNSTNIAPVNCANVKISLSTDGGFTYPVILAQSVPNTGSAMITVPNNVATTCRVKVEAIGNVFYDISNVNFRIQLPPVPTFTLETAQPEASVCAGTDASIAVITSSILAFSDPVTLSMSGAPAGASVQINPNPVTPGSNASISISNLNNSDAGNYVLNITGTSGSVVRNSSFSLTVLGSVTGSTPNLTSPADGAVAVNSGSLLTWDAVPNATDYSVEFCTNPGFTPAGSVTTLNSTSTSLALPSSLTASTPYYWRVKASNICGAGPFSAARAFQTAGISCNQVFNSTNVPVLIDVAGAAQVSSIISIPQAKTIVDVNLSASIPHTYVGDLEAKLVGPGGVTVSLFNRPDFPASDFGCDGDDLELTFDDEASATAAVLEGTCSNLPAISGSFQPINPLSVYDNTNAQGTWTLTVKDNYPGEDSGEISNWSLTFCFAGTVGEASLLSNNPLQVNQGTSKNIVASNLQGSASGSPAQLRFTLLDLPVHGTLELNGTALSAIGAGFTQADIDGGLLRYVHDASAGTMDQFRFDLWDQNNNGWLHNQTFLINILQNTLVSSAAVTHAVSCHGDSNAEITVNATGGTAPLAYSLNGAVAQSSNLFSGLGAGNYNIVVTDANGFTQSAGPITIAEPEAISLTVSVVTNDLSAAASGGTGNLSYSIDGTNFQADPNFNDLADGFYTLSVQDENGCSTSEEVIVSVASLLAQTIQTESITCNGAANAAIQVNVAGGISPYGYSLNGIDFQISNAFSGLAAGTYTVVVKDAIGTTSATAPIVIGQPDVLSASASVLLNSITVTASGGNNTYSYQLDGGTAQSSNVFNNLANGTYTIVVSDENGCSANISATVNVAQLAITNLAVGNISACSGIAETVTVEANGGIPPYQYRIDGGAWQNSVVFMSVAPGIHSVEVLDAQGTTAVGSLETDQPVPVSATASVVGNDVSVSGAGGTAPYTYTLNNGTPQSDNHFNNLSNGNYTVVVSDINGCSSSTTFSVNYTPMSYTFSKTDVSCAGLNDGSINSINIVGGLPPYTPAIPLPVENLSAGVYTYSVTDAAGSSLSISIPILEPSALSGTAAVTGDSIIVSASGGTSPYQYSINNGQNYQSSPIFGDLGEGTYEIKIKDAHGCITTLEAIIIFSGSTELENAWGIRVSPNPGRDIFHLNMKKAPQGSMRLELLDISGRVLSVETLEVTGSDLQRSFDLSQSTSGLYLLKLTHGFETVALRLMLIK